MKYSVINLGCKVNRVESDSFERKLSGFAGAHPATSDADVVVINTCTVTSTAEKKTRKCVRRALKDHPRATVIVTGCAAAQNKGVYETMSARVLVSDRFDVLDAIDKVLSEPACAASVGADACRTFDCNRSTPIPDKPAPVSERVSRVGVKVQDGCDNDCSYCIVHKLRGPERSVPIGSVVEECLRLSSSGIPEIVLTGINTGKYRFEGSGLTGLATRLLSLQLPSRLRISSIEPADFDIELARIAEESGGMLCRHFHIPMQSGCSRTLGEMNRNYDAGFARELVARIRQLAPTASISTDMIVGFPGESESDFEETYGFCKEMGFSKIHVFPYSRREGTPAHDRADQVDPDVRKRRARALSKLAQQMRDADLASRAGTTELIAVETGDDSLTESYHWVKTPSGASPRSLMPMKL